MALLNRKQVVSLAVESTEGTVVTPGVSGAGFNTFDTTFSPEVEQYERNPFRSSLGRLASIAGVKTATVGFTTELVGSGDHTLAGDALPFHDLMLACGYEKVGVDALTISAMSGTNFTAGETISAVGGASGVCALSTKTADTTLYVTAASTITASGALSGGTSGASSTAATNVSTDAAVMYKPVSTGTSTYTVALYNDGIRHRVKGCRGNVSFSGSTGQPVRMAFEFTGPFEDTADEDLITPTYPSLVPPSMLGAGLSVHGDLLVVDSFEVATGNELAVRRSANDDAGAISTKITMRSMSGSIDPEVELKVTHDFIGKLTGNTEGLLDFTIGGTTGNKFRIQGPNCSYAGVSGGERGGISTYSMDLSLNETSLGDNDFRLLCF